MARQSASKRRGGRFGRVHRRATRTTPHRTRRVGLEPLEPRMMLTSFASLEQGRMDVNSPIEGLPAPISELIQASHLQGGSFTNTYGVDEEGRALVRKVGAIRVVALRSVTGAAIEGPRGPGESPDRLVLGFAFDGFVETDGTDQWVTHYTSGRAGIFATLEFFRLDPTLWDTSGGVFDDPLISWTLAEPQLVVAGDGAQLTGSQPQAVNRNAVNASIQHMSQGKFLLDEDTPEEPPYPITTPGQRTFLDVTTGHDRFEPDPQEGIFLNFGQSTTTRFVSGVTSGPRTELREDQFEVLEALGRFAFQFDDERDHPVGENNGVKHYFATSINDPDDALQGFYVVMDTPNRIQGFDGSTTGGDLFQNQDTVEAYPVLLGQRRQDLIVISPDKGNQSSPFIHLVNRETGELVHRFLVYNESYRGGVRVATGDLTGDGIDEIITAPGRDHRPLVRVFDQQGQLLTEFLAFAPSFTSGIDVAVGDVTGNGHNDIVVGQSLHGSKVQVFENAGGLVFNPYQNAFEAFPGFLGGVTVEVADMGTFLDGNIIEDDEPDGRSEIIVGNEAGMRSMVRVFDTSGSTATSVREFQPFSSDPNFYHNFLGGVSIDLAHVDEDQTPDLIVGAGNRGGSRVQVLNGLDGTLITPTFTAYSPGETNSANAPVRVAAIDSNEDGRADRIAVAQGSDGTTRLIRSFDALTADLVDEFFENSPDFGGAYFVTALERPDPKWANDPDSSGEHATSAPNNSALPSEPATDQPVASEKATVPMTLNQWRRTRIGWPLARLRETSEETNGAGTGDSGENPSISDPTDDLARWAQRRGWFLAAP